MHKFKPNAIESWVTTVSTETLFLNLRRVSLFLLQEGVELFD